MYGVQYLLRPKYTCLIDYRHGSIIHAVGRESSRSSVFTHSPYNNFFLSITPKIIIFALAVGALIILWDSIESEFRGLS